MVSLKVHNVLDYVIGVVLLLCPSVFGFSGLDAARNLFVVLGCAIIAYSLLTAYPYSILKWIPVGWHMALDVLVGISLIMGAYVFGYNEFLSMGQTALHFVLGIGAIALVAMTTPKSDRRNVAEPIDINRRAA